MVIDDFDKITLTSKKKLDFKKCYKMWRNFLVNRVIDIFTWKNLPQMETVDLPIPQKEIELLLTLVGFCGFTELRRTNEYGIVYGSMSGVTNYPDMFKMFTYATPLESGMKNVGDNIVVINNNQLRNPTMEIIETYATLLAHTDLSLQAILINSRATAMVKAKTQQQVDEVAHFYKALADGKTLAILDKDDNLDSPLSDTGMQLFNFSYPNAISIDSYYQIRENLLRSFYSDIGIISNRDKRERVVQAELDTNLNRVLFNIDDMLQCRKDACKEINAMFGLNISVELNSNIIKQQSTSAVEQKSFSALQNDTRGSNNDSNEAV